MNQSTSREFLFIVTQSCNYNCLFCHGEKLKGERINLLNTFDYEFLYSVGKDCFGFKSVTLTGGEPLFRGDIVDIAHVLKEKNCDITINTNGSLLGERMDVGNYIKCLNVSLHTLKWNCYEQIVQRRNMFYSMIYELRLFRDLYPKVEICLNVSLAEGLNSTEKDFIELLDFAESINSSIKFVELFPPNVEGFFPLEYLDTYLNNKEFEKLSYLIKKDKNQHKSLIVSPDGKIKPIKNLEIEVDILQAVKSRNIDLTKQGIEDALDLLENIRLN